MIRVRPDTARHKITVVHDGATSTHLVDLEPGWTVWYTPQTAAGAPVATNRLWADATGRLWADATTRQWAA